MDLVRYDSSACSIRQESAHCRQFPGNVETSPCMRAIANTRLLILRVIPIKVPTSSMAQRYLASTRVLIRGLTAARTLHIVICLLPKETGHYAAKQFGSGRGNSGACNRELSWLPLFCSKCGELSPSSIEKYLHEDVVLSSGRGKIELL